MFVLSPNATSLVITSDDLLTGKDSPVKEDSSTSKLLVSIILASADTLTPLSRNIISPLTSSSAGTSRFSPSLCLDLFGSVLRFWC